MTGLLIVVAVTALLIIALGPAHRRAQRHSPAPFRPGADVKTDRDRQRVLAEITAVASPERSEPERSRCPNPSQDCPTPAGKATTQRTVRVPANASSAS